MALFETKPVTLGEIEGHGYAFKRKTAFGQAVRGIVFLDDEERAEQLQDEDSITFSGPCYFRDRSKESEIDVKVEDVTTTPMGTRVDFVEVDYPETLLK
jgi:hypothetical protein